MTSRLVDDPIPGDYYGQVRGVSFATDPVNGRTFERGGLPWRSVIHLEEGEPRQWLWRGWVSMLPPSLDWETFKKGVLDNA